MAAVETAKDLASNGHAVDNKLEELRSKMAAADGGKGVHAYIIPNEDPHMVCKLANSLMTLIRDLCMLLLQAKGGSCLSPSRVLLSWAC